MTPLLLPLTIFVSLLLIQGAPPSDLIFPPGFQFGAATASYQVEGAYVTDGRGSTVWDTFSHAGHCYKGETGDVADDHYNRIAEDILLMKNLGIKVYRMSFAWSRIMPTGLPPVNPLGIAHYNMEINMLLAANITPHVTLYHWDTPSSLEQVYGDAWLRPETADAFAEYAAACFQAFGDRVKNWLTLNEPHTVAVNGYAYGSHAPGRCSDRSVCLYGNSSTEPYLAAHNMLLAHAKAVKIYRTNFQPTQNGVIGIVLDCTWGEPLTNNSADVDAANRYIEFFASWFADPVFKGDYPPSMKKYVGPRLPQFTEDQKQLLKGSADFYALNHYTSRYLSSSSTPIGAGPDADSLTLQSTIRNGQPIGPQADSPWLYVVPWGIMKTALWLRERYGDLDFWITENGVDVPEESNLPLVQALNDTYRVNYYHDYLFYLLAAINDPVTPVRVKGYFAWSLMDNFEWNDGYSKRFGIHYVDYNDNLKRYQKASAVFFKNLINSQVN